MKKLCPLVLLSLVLVMPLVSAQLYYGFLNPSDLLDNPWFIFTAFFAVFFGVIYLSLGRVLGGTTPTLIIAAALGFVIAAGVQKKWFFLQQPIMFWAVILVVTLIALAFIKFLFGGETNPWMALGFIAVLWGLWPFLKNLLPTDAVASIPYSVVEFLDNTWFIALIAAIAGLIFWGKKKGAKLKASLRPESYKFN